MEETTSQTHIKEQIVAYQLRARTFLDDRRYEDSCSVLSQALDLVHSRNDAELKLLEADILEGTAKALEAILDQIVYQNENLNSSSFSLQTNSLLAKIASAYRKRADCLKQLLNLGLSMVSFEMVGDAYLDSALAFKKTGMNVSDCLNSHLSRMELCPRYRTIDAVRLLGLRVPNGIGTGKGTDLLKEAEELNDRGIFQLHQDEINNYTPTEAACNLGDAVRDLFLSNGYNFRQCQNFLLRIGNFPSSIKTRSDRIFSSHSFFNRRHSLCVTDICQDADASFGAEILCCLFLFGLALPRDSIASAIGEKGVELLLEAGILVLSLASNSCLVAETMVYPLSPSDLDCHGSSTTCFFLTDWPMESFRLTRDAVMPIGYDTLELLSLSACTDRITGGRILDLCCGSGVQGIFAFVCSAELQDHRKWAGITATDVNMRAIHFATANAALNGAGRNGVFSAFCGNLYDPLCTLLNPIHFDRILCNPPFVAIPSCQVLVQLEPARYAVGGGGDGMDVLRQIMWRCCEFLSSSGQLLMVTELPNVELSCELLQSFLPSCEQANVKIKVAYVKNDVETVEEYSRVREEEAGNTIINRDWSQALAESGVYNRALSLVSISREKGAGLLRLFEFWPDVGPDSETNSDEEDSFLTQEGMEFSRKAIL